MLASLLEMLLKCGAQFLGSGRLSHLRQCFHQLIFGAEQILQFVDIQLLQCVGFHFFALQD